VHEFDSSIIALIGMYLRETDQKTAIQTASRLPPVSKLTALPPIPMDQSDMKRLLTERVIAVSPNNLLPMVRQGVQDGIVSGLLLDGFIKHFHGDFSEDASEIFGSLLRLQGRTAHGEFLCAFYRFITEPLTQSYFARYLDGKYPECPPHPLQQFSSLFGVKPMNETPLQVSNTEIIPTPTGVSVRVYFESEELFCLKGTHGVPVIGQCRLPSQPKGIQHFSSGSCTITMTCVMHQEKELERTVTVRNLPSVPILDPHQNVLAVVTPLLDEVTKTSEAGMISLLFTEDNYTINWLSEHEPSEAARTRIAAFVRSWVIVQIPVPLHVPKTATKIK
jgi:hypothetical protein